VDSVPEPALAPAGREGMRRSLWCAELMSTDPIPFFVEKDLRGASRTLDAQDVGDP
jgi:hypothetical protein